MSQFKSKKIPRTGKLAPTTSKLSSIAPKFFEVAEDNTMISDEDDGKLSVGSFDKMFENLQAKMHKQASKASDPANESKSGKAINKKATATERILGLTNGHITTVESKQHSKLKNESNLNYGEPFCDCDDIDRLLSLDTPPLPGSKPVKTKDDPGRRGLSKSESRKNRIPIRGEFDDDDVEVVEDTVPSFDLSTCSPQCLTPTVAPSTLPFTVRIRWKQEIFKFKLCEMDYCFEIRRLLAQELHLIPRELMIFFEDDTDKPFDDAKTLKDAGIRLGTILEAERRILEASSQMPVKQLKDPTLIRIKVQSVERRSEVYYEVRKTDPFRQLQYLFCQKMDFSPSRVKFRFDGETVDLDDTPEDLDLEGDECFDVIVSQS